MHKKYSIPKIWWVWHCFYIFFLGWCFFRMKTHLITGCHQQDSHYLVFMLFFKCFREFGFVRFVSFFCFTSFQFFLYSHATHLSLKNLVCGFKTVPCTGMHTFFTAIEVRFVSTLKETFVFVPSNPLFSHISF